MKIKPHFNRLCLTALALAAVGLRAQEGPLSNVEFKLRGGLTQGALFDDLGAQQMMGVGVGSHLAMEKGRLTFELGFDYFPGKEHTNLPAGGTFYYRADSAASSYNGLPVMISHVPPKNAGLGSADSRKNRMQGFVLRTGYAAPLTGEWEWQAGLSLHMLKSIEEASGTLYPYTVVNGTATSIVNPGSPGGTVLYYESLSKVSEKTKPNFGAYVGVCRKVSEDARFELNLRSVGYTQLKYQPYTYTGKPAATTETNRMGFALECGFGIRL